MYVRAAGVASNRYVCVSVGYVCMYRLLVWLVIGMSVCLLGMYE